MSLLLLVHGGGTTAHHWDLTLERLSTPALAVNLPGRLDRPADLTTVTLEDAVGSVADDAESSGAESFVVVAHSSGGLVVPGVVERLGRRVRHIVFCSASIPPEGGGGLDCMKPRHGEAVAGLRRHTEETGESFTTPADPPDREQLRGAYGTTLTDEQIDFLVDPRRWVPDTYNFYFGKVSWAAAHDTPRTYLLNLRDRAVPVALQEEMISRLPGTGVLPLDSGHIPAVTMPAVMAALLDGTAADCDRRSGAGG